MCKAFDEMWYEGLICKLEQNGVTGNLFFKNYLSDREQKVVLNGAYAGR